MTREDVLSGVRFKWKGTAVYNVEPDQHGAEFGGYIASHMGYECNVSSFGPYAMRWFTYVMGKKVSGLINYKSLSPYIEAPEPATRLSTQLNKDQVRELLEADAA